MENHILGVTEVNNLVKTLLENPELLDMPADTPVEYSIKR